jgi:SMODS and SLOG-associating 2TM effector domain family 5
MSSNPMIDFLEKLRTDAWRTSNGRYDAARRLKRRDILATFSISMFSALTIAIAFFQKLYGLQPSGWLDKYLTAFTVCLGICILVISLIEWGVSNGVRGAALHRNAEELNYFQRELSQKLAEIASTGTISINDVDTAREKYDQIKRSCEHNHSPIDDWHVRAIRRLSPEFCDTSGRPIMSWIEAQRIRLAWTISTASYFGILWLIVVGFAAWPLFHK